MPAGSGTILDALIQSLGAAADYNSQVMVAPVAVLWTDEGRQWEPLIPMLRERATHLLTMGPYDPEQRSGPAIWLRLMVDRALPAAQEWGSGVTPILYLPGVARKDLRAIEDCPRPLIPLAELQYRSTFWTHPNGRDWTVFAWMTVEDGGLGLDVAQDRDTQEALRRALTTLAATPVGALRDRRLEAPDFDALLTTDPIRDLLRWLNDPERVRQELEGKKWESFRAICKTNLKFDPQADGALAGAERLGRAEGGWAKVWGRYAEAPRHYPHLPALLEQARPSDLSVRPDTWPQVNRDQEATLRGALMALEKAADERARAAIVELEKTHGKRRDWVWAGLGQAPLARALEHLAALADVTSKTIGGHTAKDLAAEYAKRGWEGDRAAIAALAEAEGGHDREAVGKALRALYLPWLDRHARHLQEIIHREGPPAAPPIMQAEKGECLVFADGLRFDLAQRLNDGMKEAGYGTSVGWRWSGVPSVTPTAKPAVSPIVELLSMDSPCQDFLPTVMEPHRKLEIILFRQLLETLGYQVLKDNQTGNPDGRAWAETGNIDQYGHNMGVGLAGQIDNQLQALAKRVEGLLEAGWSRVTVVTDHGWLLMPGGLPAVSLPKYLADTRWGRCALLKETTKADDMLMLPWRWNAAVMIALAPGVSCYRAGLEYTHGGLSLQECVTPVVTVQAKATEQKVQIVNVEWPRRGSMRAYVHLKGDWEHHIVDMRSSAADKSTSILMSAVGASEKVSIVVDDVKLEEIRKQRGDQIEMNVVVVDQNGSVVAKLSTIIGGDY